MSQALYVPLELLRKRDAPERVMISMGLWGDSGVIYLLAGFEEMWNGWATRGLQMSTMMFSIVYNVVGLP